MKLTSKIKLSVVLAMIFLLLPVHNKIHAQYNNKWMTAGSFQDWYSEIGCEVEEGFVKQQQYGGEWPALYPNQDSKAARGLWIGATNFTDENGDNWPYKVVHCGPRVTGAGEFFPVSFKLYTKFELPQVYVDGTPSYYHPTEVDEVDPNMKPDMEIINVVNTQLGLTMTRKIMQFSEPGEDNYMIYDYTFTNTGNTNGDSKIELPNNTLTGVYFYWQYRNASNEETRYEIGNATGWGINTMNDARGDGADNIAKYNDPPNERFRAQFSYHGHYPSFTLYDNLGGPLWSAATDVPAGDTVGRLSAIQFYGVVTIHADKSTDDTSDDINEPSTTNYISSDALYESNNSSFNEPGMQTEYLTVMSTGHETPRHVWKVQPDGKFDEPTGDPSLGTTGGYSFGNGYGPYTIKPGQSIHIVMAEGISGLSREAATRIGIEYKKGEITAKEKNDSVLTGQDSLFKTFRNAIANYNNGYNLPPAPRPPASVNINSGGDKINVSWSVATVDPNVDHFEIYRATGQYDSTYHLIAKVPANGGSSYSYDDTSPIRGILYYYYVTAVATNGESSNRYYTQTYDPATLKRPAGTNMSQIRVVPNPYNISAQQQLGFGAQQPNRLAFFNIPGHCTIRIYTEIGELIYTIHHTDGSGDAYWDSVTSSQQLVVSGIYIAVIHNDDTGEQSIVKFVIIR